MSKDTSATRSMVIQLLSPADGRVVRTIPGNSITIYGDGTVCWIDDAGNHHKIRAE